MDNTFYTMYVCVNNYFHSIFRIIFEPTIPQYINFTHSLDNKLAGSKCSIVH